MNTSPLVIIGSGPAGYTAAIYAARANLSPVVFAGGAAESDPRRVPGGQLMLTSEVENFPGFPDGIQGPELMEHMEKQAARFQTVIHKENVLSLDLSVRPFVVKGETLTTSAHAIVLSTGATAKWLSIPGENEFMNRGVSACATCDGFFFRGKSVLVAGGGDTALEEANYLSKLCSHVTVIHRRDALRASKVMQDRAFANEKISFVWDSAIEEVLGDDKGMHSVRLRNLKTKATSTLESKALFVAIGHTPVVELVRDTLKLQPNGYLWVEPGSTRTSLEGVFAAGDVTDSKFRQAVTAAGMGCMAAIEAQHYLADRGIT